MDQIIFMQDGAPPHIANPVKQLLKRHFENARIISRHFFTGWLFRSPDLNPSDFWLWGYLKNVVFNTPIAHLDELKTSTAQCVPIENVFNSSMYTFEFSLLLKKLSIAY